MGLEYLIWEVVLKGEPGEHNGIEVDEEELARLRNLSVLIGGWIYWPDNAPREAFIPLAEWEAEYAKHIAKTKG